MRGDWSEYCQTLAYANWTGALRPCFKRFGDCQDLYNFDECTFESPRWATSQPEDHHHACGRLKRREKRVFAGGAGGREGTRKRSVQIWLKVYFLKEIEKKEGKEMRKRRRLPKARWTLGKFGRWLMFRLCSGNVWWWSGQHRSALHTEVDKR